MWWWWEQVARVSWLACMLHALPRPLSSASYIPHAPEFTLLATLTRVGGAALPPITGLAIQSATGLWFAVAQTTGELFSINPSTLTAQVLATLASPSVLRLGALETDADSRYLLSLDDATSGTRLIEIDLAPTRPTYRIVGAVGLGATDCNALARTGDGRLLTTDVSTGRLLEINRQTGAATFLSNVQGSFFTAGGMAWIDGECPADFDHSGGVDAQDLATFFEIYESGKAAADLNHSGGIEADDIAVFIQAYEQGC